MKKLLTLIAACGLTVSAWALTPEAEAADPVPTGQAGWAVVHYTFKWMGWSRMDSVVYDLAMAAGQGVGGALGGLAGSTLGPVGTVVGGGLGAV